MTQQKVVITKESSTINEYLKDGWTILSVTAQHVGTSSTSSITSIVKGDFCFVLEK